MPTLKCIPGPAGQQNRPSCRQGKFRKVIIRYKRTGYNINIMQRSACLVVNPITVTGNIFASISNCISVGRASSSTMDQI